jgi:hypothetical protein
MSPLDLKEKLLLIKEEQKIFSGSQLLGPPDGSDFKN